MSSRQNIRILAASLALVLAAGHAAHAQFVGARFNGQGGNTINEGQAGIHNNAVAASGIYSHANWQDSGNPGGPNDFSSSNGFTDFPIPGDNIGVDEDNWTLVGSGVLTVNISGNYTFRTATDDASRIVLAGRNVAIQAGCCNNVNGTNAIPLVAGQKYAIQTIVKEGNGGGGGEFSVSRDGGSFQLLGTGGSDFTVTPDIGAPVGYVPVTAGLSAKIYNTPGLNNQNRDTNTFLAGNPTPASTLTATSASSGPLPVDTLVTYEGLIRIDAADDIAPGAPGIQVKFVIDSDDNARLTLAGLVIMENDGGHGTNHLVSENQDLLSAGTGDNAGGTQLITFGTAGYYDLTGYVHNGGGGGSGNILSSIGGVNGAMSTVPNDRIFLAVPEPASAMLLAFGGLALVARRRRA